MHLGTEFVDGLRWEPSAPQGRECEEPRVIPVSDNVVCNKLLYLPLGDDGIEEVHASVLPLHGTIYVQCIAEPIVGGTPVGAGAECMWGRRRGEVRIERMEV